MEYMHVSMLRSHDLNQDTNISEIVVSEISLNIRNKFTTMKNHLNKQQEHRLK